MSETTPEVDVEMPVILDDDLDADFDPDTLDSDDEEGAA